MTLLKTLWRETALHLWQTTVVLGVIAILARPLRFAPARYQHALWWIALGALALPLRLVRPLWLLVAPETAVTSPVVAYVSVAVRPPLVVEGAAAVSAGGPIWIILLTGVWALGAAWLCGHWVTALFAQKLDCTPEAVQRKVLAAISGTDIPARRIYVGETRLVPAVMGLLRPRILLPRRVVDALDPEALRSVLLHEHWHCRRPDPLLSALQRVILAVFFFYPPAWWLTRRLRDSAEIVCDAAVLRAGISAETYSRALARTLSLDLLPVSIAAVGLGRGSGLGQRLDRIDYPRRYRVMLRYRLAVAATVIALAVVSYLPLRAASEAQQTLPAAEVETGARTFARLSGIVTDNTGGVLPGTTFTLVNIRSEIEHKAITNGAGRFEFIGLTPGDYLQESKLPGFGCELCRVTMFGPDVLQDVTLSVGTLEETVIVSRGPEPVSDAPWPTSPRNLAGCSHDWAIAEVETDEAGAAGPRVRVGGNIVPPMKTHHVTPRYPRGANVEGTVVLDGVITADGVMDKLEVVGEADPELESATVAAGRDWTYSSTRLNGVPIPAWMRVTVHFRNP